MLQNTNVLSANISGSWENIKRASKIWSTNWFHSYLPQECPLNTSFAHPLSMHLGWVEVDLREYIQAFDSNAVGSDEPTVSVIRVTVTTY